MREIGATKQSQRIELAVQQCMRAWLNGGATGAAQPVVIGVSGGMDSMCLLHLLVAQAADLGIEPQVAHLNHHLRGSESEADEALIVSTARDFGLPCTVGHADVATIAVDTHRSIELAAREARYRFLGVTALAIGAKAVVLAHHADDQAETLLLRLIRGTGLTGLTGMRQCAALPYSNVQDRLKVVRPLLTISRSEISKHVRERAIAYRHDSSNDSLEHMRNRVRTKLMPILEEFNPGIRKVLLHLSDSAAEESDIASTAIAVAWMDCHVPGQVNCLDRLRWQFQSPGYQRGLLREGARRSQGDLMHLRFSAIEEARHVILSGTRKAQISLTARLTIELSANMLCFVVRPL